MKNIISSLTTSVASNKGQYVLRRSHLPSGKIGKPHSVAPSLKEPNNPFQASRNKERTQNCDLLAQFTGYPISDEEDEKERVEAEKQPIERQRHQFGNSLRKSKSTGPFKSPEFVASDSDSINEPEGCEKNCSAPA
jgi:hypothetical protein